MTPEAVEKAVLIYGPRKSGSTLLESLLDGGNQLLMMPGELKLKVMHQLVLEPPVRQVASYLARGRTYFYDLNLGDPARRAHQLSLGHLAQEQLEARLDVEAYLAALSGLSGREDLDLPALYRADASAFAAAMKQQKQGHACWASKEVGGLPSAILAHFKAAFPRSKVVLGVRDPRFIVASIVRDRIRRGIPMSPSRVVAQCFEAENVLHFIATVPLGDNAIVVKYENLVADVPGQMQRLARFLEIDFHERFTVPTTLGVPTRVWTASEDKVEVFRDPNRAWHHGLPRWAAATMAAYFAISQRRGQHAAVDVSQALEARALEPA